VPSLEAPSLTAPLATLADWMELWALTSPRRIATDSELTAISQAGEDETPTDPIQADAETEALFNDVFGELERRARAAGVAYPFVLDARGTTLTAVAPPLSDAQVVYVFCLLVSEYRRAQLLAKPVFERHAAAVEDLFQVCSTIAAAGLLGGGAVSFGFPRPDGSGFLTALRRTFEGRVREGRTEVAVRAGVTSHPKDAGIDVVAWRSFPDELPGKLYLLGQCASGAQYRNKSVRHFLAPFHGDWFTQQPGSPPIEALFVPFVLDQELTPRRGESMGEARAGLYLSLARSLGVLVDRCRMAYLVDLGAARAAAAPLEVERAGELADVRAWVDAVLTGA
jgi:hypothetical protein